MTDNPSKEELKRQAEEINEWDEDSRRELFRQIGFSTPAERVDLCYKLAERAWARFKARRNMGWKTSAGIWTVFGVAIITMISTEAWAPGIASCVVATGLAIGALILLAFFWFPFMEREYHRESYVSYYWETHIRKVLRPEEDLLPSFLRPASHRADDDIKKDWPSAFDEDVSKVGGKADSREERQPPGKKWHIVSVLHFCTTVAFAASFVLVVWSKGCQSNFGLTPPSGPATPLESGPSMTTAGWITLIIAGWGAALSTFLAYRGWKRERPQIVIKANELRVQTDEFNEWLIVVRIENWGEKSVRIEEVYFTTERDRFRWLRRVRWFHRILPPSYGQRMTERQEVCGRESGRLPSEIAPESSHTIHYDAARLVESFTKSAKHGTLCVYASCHDPLYRDWWAKPFRVQIDGSLDAESVTPESSQERKETDDEA